MHTHTFHKIISVKQGWASWPLAHAWFTKRQQCNKEALVNAHTSRHPSLANSIIQALHHIQPTLFKVLP